MCVEANMEKSLHERGIEASAAYLKRRGYEIVEVNAHPDDDEFPIVAASEEQGLCFVDVFVGGDEESPFPAAPDCREWMRSFESRAVRFLAEKGEGFLNLGMRYDRIDIHVVSDDKAAIRHQINVLA